MSTVSTMEKVFDPPFLTWLHKYAAKNSMSYEYALKQAWLQYHSARLKPAKLFR